MGKAGMLKFIVKIKIQLLICLSLSACGGSKMRLRDVRFRDGSAIHYAADEVKASAPSAQNLPEGYTFENPVVFGFALLPNPARRTAKLIRDREHLLPLLKRMCGELGHPEQVTRDDMILMPVLPANSRIEAGPPFVLVGQCAPKEADDGAAPTAQSE